MVTDLSNIRYGRKSSEKILSGLPVLQRGRLRWREREGENSESAFMMETGVGHLWGKIHLFHIYLSRAWHY